MSRKLLKSMGRDGQRRRSPRISGLGCKENQENKQLSGTRTRMKRKFDDSVFAPVSKLAKQVWKGRDSPQSEDHSIDFVEWRSVRESQMIKENRKHYDHANKNGKRSIMPAKHVLELVLDTLQRRDTYEIFAEPVDPDEVEEYYEIIKEPMDFGTMRAKLHEGMYDDLENFEHDVFLIPENAMYFNSSATIYFRQARAIHELAKKVFHVLKTDPENFVSEFSGTRRRSMRKALSDTRDSIVPAPKSDDVYTQGTLQCPSTSTFRRTNKKNSGTTDHFHARNFLTESGIRYGRLSSSQVEDSRFSYLDNKEYIDLTFHSSCKQLVLMNQGDISYKDSLMSYVKDLGPIAQMVAKRKLLGPLESNSCRNGKEQCQNYGDFIAKQFKTFPDFTPASCNHFLKASNTIIDLTKDGEEGNERIMRKEKTTIYINNPGKEKIDTPKIFRDITRNSMPDSRDLNCSTSRINNSTGNKVRPVILALENPHSNVAEFKSRNRKSSIAPTPWTKNRPISDEAQQLLQQRLPTVAHFAFDLSFLKTRLNQMNVVDIGGKFRC